MTTKTLKKSVLNTDSDVQTFPEEEENQKKKSWEKTRLPLNIGHKESKKVELEPTTIGWVKSSRNWAL